MDVLKDEYEKCRGDYESADILIPFYENSKFGDLMENCCAKVLELITSCANFWPPENQEEEQRLYMAAHAFSPELVIKEARAWIAEVEKDHKCRSNYAITRFCDWLNAYGKLPLDPVDPQKFMLKDEPWIADGVASELQDCYTALCEYKAALCEYGEWWNSRSAAGYLKKAVLKTVKNPITGLIDAVGNGIAEAFGEDEDSQIKRKLIAKVNAAVNLWISYDDKLRDAVIKIQDSKSDPDYWNKIFTGIACEFDRLNNLIDSDTKPLQIAGVPNASAPAASSTTPVIASLEKPASANSDVAVSVPAAGSDEEEIDYVEIARDITEAMTIGEIRALLEEHGLDSSGLKKNLIGRLARALEDGKIKITN